MRSTNPCGNAHLKNTHCRECERLKETTPPTLLSDAVHGSDEAPPGGYSGSPVNKCREQAGESPIQLSEGNEGRYETKTPRPGLKSAAVGTIPSQELNERATSQSDPLTPAEKQKAYRERHKDRVREADRLRKRKQRESDSDSD